MIIATGVRSPSHVESEYHGNEYAAYRQSTPYLLLFCAPTCLGVRSRLTWRMSR